MKIERGREIERLKEREVVRDQRDRQRETERERGDRKAAPVLVEVSCKHAGCDYACKTRRRAIV
jgi:hypothetical protein